MLTHGAVWQSDKASCVGSDEVTPDRVARGIGHDLDADHVSRNHIGVVLGRSTDDVTGRSSISARNQHTDAVMTELVTVLGRAIRINHEPIGSSTDTISLNLVTMRLIPDHDTMADIRHTGGRPASGDHVIANEIVGRIRDDDSRTKVPQRHGTVLVRTDEVVADDRSSRHVATAEFSNSDGAIPVRAAEHVAFLGLVPTNLVVLTAENLHAYQIVRQRFFTGDVRTEIVPKHVIVGAANDDVADDDVSILRLDATNAVGIAEKFYTRGTGSRLGRIVVRADEVPNDRVTGTQKT